MGVRPFPKKEILAGTNHKCRRVFLPAAIGKNFDTAAPVRQTAKPAAMRKLRCDQLEQPYAARCAFNALGQYESHPPPGVTKMIVQLQSLCRSQRQ
jgi:hypothetical protein